MGCDEVLSMMRKLKSSSGWFCIQTDISRLIKMSRENILDQSEGQPVQTGGPSDRNIQAG